MYVRSSNNNEITQNQMCNNSRYGVYISYGTSNRIWNNTFIDNNGAGSSHNPAHLQAYDAGTGNYWNSSSYGNYWSDWTTPDTDHNGIVDAPYVLGGGSDARDEYPLI